MALVLESILEETMYGNPQPVQAPQVPSAKMIRAKPWSKNSQSIDTTTELRCQALVERLSHQHGAVYFNELPSQEALPYYYHVITTPVAFSTVKSRLANHEYRDLLDIEVDLRLVFENCKYFNAHWAEVSVLGRALEASFQEEWKNLTGQTVLEPLGNVSPNDPPVKLGDNEGRKRIIAPSPVPVPSPAPVPTPTPTAAPAPILKIKFVSPWSFSLHFKESH